MSCNIGLIGFFGAGAYSDDLIEYTTRTLLLKHNPKAQIDYKWREKMNLEQQIRLNEHLENYLIKFGYKINL